MRKLMLMAAVIAAIALANVGPALALAVEGLI